MEIINRYIKIKKYLKESNLEKESINQLNENKKKSSVFNLLIYFMSFIVMFLSHYLVVYMHDFNYLMIVNLVLSVVSSHCLYLSLKNFVNIKKLKFNFLRKSILIPVYYTLFMSSLYSIENFFLLISLITIIIQILIINKTPELLKERKELNDIESNINKMDDKEIYKILKYSETLTPENHSYFYSIYETAIKTKFKKINHLDVVKLKVKSQVNELKINH